jgi:hypothetical protein
VVLEDKQLGDLWKHDDLGFDTRCALELPTSIANILVPEVFPAVGSGAHRMLGRWPGCRRPGIGDLGGRNTPAHLAD